MEEPSRLWADVFVEDEDIRAFLEGKALFYIPRANALAGRYGQNIAKLNARSITAKADGKKDLPGKQVIGKIINAEEPVSYDSAVNFLTLLNQVVTEPADQLTTEDIVACVFRIRDAHYLKQLPIGPEEIARGSGLRKVLIETAIDPDDRTRITLHDAMRIWTFLRKWINENKPGLTETAEAAANDSDKPEWSDEILELLNGDPLNFIIADRSKRYPVEVALIGSMSPDDPEQTYVYSRSLLIKAPRTGHPWAIDFTSEVPGVDEQTGQ